MVDEIDVETDRLEYLMAQKLKRQAEIIKENEGLFWVKPKVGDAEHPHQYADVIMPGGKVVDLHKRKPLNDLTNQTEVYYVEERDN